jgi:putative N6-adenine-specific DNA methylase
VKYRGNLETIYKSNLHLRTAIKILCPIAVFQAFNDDKLYKKIKQVEWEKYMDVTGTFSVDATTFGEVFRHSKFVALRVKDAIADRFRERTGIRPSVDTGNPDLRINIHIADRSCTLSLDSSGDFLGKRGYRLSQTHAPISELLAAGMVILSGWNRRDDFVDPMCGSGTIPIEAAMMALNIPPGSFRSFAFEKWKEFDPDLWKKLKKEADETRIAFKGSIKGYDLEMKAIEVSNENARRAGVHGHVNFERMDFFRSKPTTPSGVVLMNPPYGERMEQKQQIAELYNNVGTHLKHSYMGWDAWIISGNLEAMKRIGLKPSKKIKLFNGPIDCRLQKYELYSGSKNFKKRTEQQ